MSNRETLRTVSLFGGFLFCHLIRLRGVAPRCSLQLGQNHVSVGRTGNRQQGASKSERSRADPFPRISHTQERVQESHADESHSVTTQADNYHGKYQKHDELT